MTVPAVPLRKVPIIIQMGPGARSDWSKAHVLCVKQKKGALLFLVTLPLCPEVNEEAQAVYYTMTKHLRILERNVDNTLPFCSYISFVFSDAVVFYYSVIQSLGFFISYSCIMPYCDSVPSGFQ